MYDYKEQKAKLDTFFKKEELQRLRQKGEKKELGSVEQVEISMKNDKQALIKHTENQLKDIRDHLKKCQELLQEESTDLQFERNVKLHEHGLGKPQRAHYKESITRGGVLAGLVGGTAVLAFVILMAGGNFELREVLLVLLLALVGGGMLLMCSYSCVSRSHYFC